jgi:hypothetical protein
MKPNEKIIGTLLVSLLVFGAQNRAEWLFAEELTHRPIESAILATDATLIHYDKVHALLTQGSPINVRVFQDRKEAAQWLSVPLLRLMAEVPSRETV